MDIKYFLGASILAGLFFFIGAFALVLAVRSWLDGDKRDKFNKFLYRFNLKGFGQIKENSVILTLAIILIYPIGDATLHILDDIFEDKIIRTNFEKEGMNCKAQDGNEPERVTQVNDRDLTNKSKEEQREILFHWYHDLDEGIPSKLKFTRIGEIEAREDEKDRDTIDKEKSYIQILQISILLNAMIGVALLIYTVGALKRRASSASQKETIRIEEPSETQIAVGWRRILSKPVVLWHRMRKQLANPLVWKPVVATILLAASIGTMFLTLEEYEENEDKYERLTFHVWKNHMNEKLTESTREMSYTNPRSVRRDQ